MSDRRCRHCRYCKLRFTDMLDGRLSKPPARWQLHYGLKRFTVRCIRGHWETDEGQAKTIGLYYLPESALDRQGADCREYESMVDNGQQGSEHSTPNLKTEPVCATGKS